MSEQEKQPVEAQIKNRFDTVLNSILSVVKSCQTDKQLECANDWASGVFLSLADLVERAESPAAARFAHSYKKYVLGRVRDLYVKMCTDGDISPVSPDDDESITIREVEPHLSVCRNCGGKGVSAHISGRTCISCKGSGRVLVASTIKTRVRPYDPKEHDHRFPFKME